MQDGLKIIRETVTIKPSRVKIVAQVSPLLSSDLFLSPSLEWAVTRLQASGLVESITRKDGSRNNYTSHTLVGEPNGVQHCTCPTSGAAHWART